MKPFYSIIFVYGLLLFNNCKNNGKGKIVDEEEPMPTPTPKNIVKISDSEDEDPPSAPQQKTLRKKMFEDIKEDLGENEFTEDEFYKLLDAAENVDITPKNYNRRKKVLSEILRKRDKKEKLFENGKLTPEGEQIVEQISREIKWQSDVLTSKKKINNENTCNAREAILYSILGQPTYVEAFKKNPNKKLCSILLNILQKINSEEQITDEDYNIVLNVLKEHKLIRDDISSLNDMNLNDILEVFLNINLVLELKPYKKMTEEEINAVAEKSKNGPGDKKWLDNLKTGINVNNVFYQINTIIALKSDEERTTEYTVFVGDNCWGDPDTITVNGFPSEKMGCHFKKIIKSN